MSSQKASTEGFANSTEGFANSTVTDIPAAREDVAGAPAVGRQISPPQTPMLGGEGRGGGRGVSCQFSSRPSPPSPDLSPQPLMK